MKKQGFTLVELLLVITIVAIASASSIMVFDKADSEADAKELAQTYVKMQRGADIYLEMNKNWLNQFVEKEEIFIRLSELQKENFVEEDLIDPTTFEMIPSDYYIYYYIDRTNKDADGNDLEAVRSCVVDISNAGTQRSIKCIANENGEACECCGNRFGNLDTGNNPKCQK